MDYKGTPLEKAKIYTIHGVEMMHITEFTTLTHRSNQSTRHLIEGGNVIRKMKHIYDRSRIMIPVAEMFGYPLVKPGHSEYEQPIYHYGIVEREDGTKDIDRVLCKECSFGTPCAARKFAEDLVLPPSD